MSHPRKYDVVVYGATGYTGGLTAMYLADKSQHEAFHWALAGRSLTKLEAVRKGLQAAYPTCKVDLIEADTGSPASLHRMAAQTRVVLTTVGPYIKYGEPLVKACVEEGAHYVDLTGEPEFVDLILERYSEAARKANVRIVSCCGFDSIPHDLGAFFAVQQLNAKLGAKAGTVPMKMEGFVRAGGSFSGGTWHSAVIAMSHFREHAKRRRESKAHRSPAGGRTVHGVPHRITKRKELNAWAAPMPTIDPQVVLRSAKDLSEYGPDFQYGHYMLVRRLPMLVAGGVGIAAVFTLAQASPTRNLLLKIRDPGQGPTAEQRAKGWFVVTMLGEAAGQTIRCEVRGGDPGYGDTSKMLAESALCLALDGAKLPAAAGVITPTVAMGNPLIDRLQAAGMTFKVVTGQGESVHS